MASEKPRTAIVIGTGVAGIAMGVNLKKQLGIEDFELYDRAERVGGVWAQNAYPNLWCDIVADMYSYSFNMKPDWPTKYASRQQIQEYLEETVAKFSISDKLNLGQECLSATWSSIESLWNLTFRDIKTKKEYRRKARFLVTAVGHSSMPKGSAAIPGLDKFQGDTIVTAKWSEPKGGFTGKDVLFIGNGASAAQVIPWLMNDAKVKSLVHIYRQPQWMLPKSNPPTPGWKKWLFRYIPLIDRIWRALSIFFLDIIALAVTKNTLGGLLRIGIRKKSTGFLKQSPEKYHDKLVPGYDFGGKRPILDHGYIECTKRDNFTIVQGDSIRGVTEDGKGIIDPEGKVRRVDIVVLANGFYPSQLTAPMKVIGDDGISLKEYWRDVGGIRAYMAVSTSKFPNLFMLGGPSHFGLGSQIFTAECTVQYILSVLQHFITLSPQSLAIRPKLSAEESYDNEIQRQMKRFVMGPIDGVNNWMVDKETGKNFISWPGTNTKFWWTRCVERVRWDDWDIK